MAYEIKKVRLSAGGTEEKHIIRVQLAGGTEESRADVVKWIDGGLRYYFTTGGGKEADVGTVHPTSGDPYIRTKPDSTIKDNLLSLDRF